MPGSQIAPGAGCPLMVMSGTGFGVYTPVAWTPIGWPGHMPGGISGLACAAAPCADPVDRATTTIITKNNTGSSRRPMAFIRPFIDHLCAEDTTLTGRFWRQSDKDAYLTE